MAIVTGAAAGTGLSFARRLAAGGAEVVLGDLDGVRVSCIVPNWIRTERAEAELAAMTPVERTHAPGTIPLEAVGDAVAELVADERARGRVVVLHPGRRRD